MLQRLLSQAIDEYKKVNRIRGMEFSDRLKRVVDEYNNRRRDEAFANEVLDDVAEQLAKLLEELKKGKRLLQGHGELTTRKKPFMTFSRRLPRSMSSSTRTIR